MPSHGHRTAVLIRPAGNSSPSHSGELAGSGPRGGEQIMVDKLVTSPDDLVWNDVDVGSSEV